MSTPSPSRNVWSRLSPTSAKGRAASYVPLYDMLCEIVTAIKDDYEASREMKALARRGRKVLNEAKARLARLSDGRKKRGAS